MIYHQFVTIRTL